MAHYLHYLPLFFLREEGEGFFLKIKFLLIGTAGLVITATEEENEELPTDVNAHIVNV